MFPNLVKLPMTGWNFLILRREAERGFSAFNSLQNYFRIFCESIILSSLYWSYRGDENLERERIAFCWMFRKRFS